MTRSKRVDLVNPDSLDSDSDSHSSSGTRLSTVRRTTIPLPTTQDPPRMDSPSSAHVLRGTTTGLSLSIPHATITSSRSPTSPTRLSPTTTIRSTHLHSLVHAAQNPSSSSSPTLLLPHISIPTTTTTTTLTSSTTPTTPTSPTSPSTPLKRRLVHKSRSRLTLHSHSSQTTLRPKQSKPSLRVLHPPSETVLEKRAENSKVFVNRLPPELLGVVFLLLIARPVVDVSLISSSSSSSGSGGGSSFFTGVGGMGGGGGMITKAPRMISQVCHFWRCIALSEPLLWARTLNLREGPKWIIESLRRSGECLIDVVGLREGVAVSSLSSSSRTSEGRGGVLRVVLNELRRIRKLHLTIERKEEWGLFVDVFGRAEAPVLESLAVKSLVRRVANVPGGELVNRYGQFGGGGGFGLGFDVDVFGGGEDVMRLPEEMFKGHAPMLKNLSLSMVSLSTATSLPWLSNLTTLQVTDLEDQYLMCVWSWLSVVRQTPLLSFLVLRNVFANEVAPSSPSHTQNVVLKKLRYIELKGTMMESCEFLEKLVVPGECRLMMSVSRANNAHAAGVLGGWLRERKMRSEHMEGILKTPMEVSREIERDKRRGRWLLVHPSANGLMIKVNEVLSEGGEEGMGMEEDEGECVVNLALSFGFGDQSEERHRHAIEIFDILTRALQMVYEDKGGFDALNLSLFGVRDGIKIWGDELVQFLAWLDRVEHLQEMSGYTASIVFPLLVQSPQQHQHQRRGSAASVTSVASTSPAERFRQNVLLPSLSRITLAFVEFAKNVDDEFEASCDVRAVPDFVKRRYGLGKEIGGISVLRQRVGSMKVRFECCSGPKSILDELRKLGVEYGLGWACDFEDS